MSAHGTNPQNIHYFVVDRFFLVWVQTSKTHKEGQISAGLGF